MTSTLTFHSDSEAKTTRLAVTCAESITAGLTIALNGQLGSGKTLFARAFCEGLKIDSSQVTSPTFVLMHLYHGLRWTVSHFDTYRLGGPDEFLALGAEEYLLNPNHICLIEWADRVAEILPHDHLQVKIGQTGPTERQFDLVSYGTVSDGLLERIRNKLALE